MRAGNRRRCGIRAGAAILTAGALAGIAVLTPGPAWSATVTGQVVMGTEGEALPADLRVMVLEQGEGTEEQAPTPAEVREDGSFTFEAEQDTGYVVGTFHGSVAYTTLVPPGTTEPLSLTIYASTDDLSGIEVASDSLTVVPGGADGGNVLEVLQLLRVVNPTDRTYSGPAEAGTGRVLELPVPESAFDVAPGDPSNPQGLATDQGRLVTTAPLRPGETSIAYLYRVEVPRSGWQLRREVLLPTDRIDLLIGRGLEFNAGPGFEFAEETELGGQLYRRYRRTDLSPGSVVAADIGFPGSSTTGLWLGSGITAVVLVALLGAAEIGRRKRKKAYRERQEKKSGVTREELIEQIARLDEEHDAGDLSDDEHSHRRAELVEQVRAWSTSQS